MQQKIRTETLSTDLNHAFTTGMLTGPGFGLCTLVAHSSGSIMGSSIRSYLWLCCGVFYQIPTLAGVLTPSGEGYKGRERMMLCLHLSFCVFSGAVSVYLLCVVAGCHGNKCLFTVCVHVVLLCISAVILASVLLSISNLFTCPIHTFCTFPSMCSLLYIFIHMSIHTVHVALWICVCARVTIEDLVAMALRGGLLTLSHSRRASFSPAYRKQTS